MFDVTIIGGGWSGLLACKHCLQEGLTVRVLEARDVIGGVWCYSDDKNIPTVMRTTRTSSSATVTEMSDFPMSDEIEDFPKHQDIQTYLLKYAKEFDLFPHIHLQTRVDSVSKEDEKWKTTTSDGEEFESRFLIVCTGIHQLTDRSVQKTLFKEFVGDIYHSGELKFCDSSWYQKRILVFGGGETASDVVENWHSTCSKIIWAIPRGQHFFRKYARLLPTRKPQALDKASSRALKLITPFTRSKPGIAWACKWTTNGSLLAYQGHGIPEWRNNAPFFHSFINKQGHVLDYVDNEKVIPKGRITFVKGRHVTFEDRTTEEIDAVILCTGYTLQFPFLPRGHQCPKMHEKYKHVFDINDPSVAFIGYTRPIVGSIPSIAEAQSRWVARVFSGKLLLPGEAERKATVVKDVEFWRNYFQGTSYRISTLVEGYTYIDDIAKLSKCYPDYWSLFRRSPMNFMVAYFGPYNGASLLLNDPEQEAKALQRIKRHSTGTMSPVFIFLFLLLRILWFDWWLDKLGQVKYHVQRSSAWNKVRDLRVTRALDKIWTLPKRCLFDSHHYD